jgi:hypothetical protein
MELLPQCELASEAQFIFSTIESAHSRSMAPQTCVQEEVYVPAR